MTRNKKQKRKKNYYIKDWYERRISALVKMYKGKIFKYGGVRGSNPLGAICWKIN